MDERFVVLQERGLSASEIATELGVTPRSVQRYRQRLGVSQPARLNMPVSPERLAAAERLLADGASFKEVARTLHMNLRTLGRYFPGRGWSRGDAALFTNAVRSIDEKRMFV